MVVHSKDNWQVDVEILKDVSYKFDLDYTEMQALLKNKELHLWMTNQLQGRNFQPILTDEQRELCRKLLGPYGQTIMKALKVKYMTNPTDYENWEEVEIDGHLINAVCNSHQLLWSDLENLLGNSKIQKWMRNLLPSGNYERVLTDDQRKLCRKLLGPYGSTILKALKIRKAYGN